MSVTRIVAGVVGVALVAATLIDAFEVMLLPRRVRRRLRFVRAYFGGTWRAWAFASRRLSSDVRGTFLSLYGPLSMLGLFAVWMAALISGFGVLHWVAAGGGRVASAPSLLTQLYFSGVTFFTLGYGDVTAHTALGRALSVAEAGLGFGLIAVVIGYLPVLHQLFSRREAYVIRLDARAGSPPTAAELLARHAVSEQGLASLGALLGECELWAAELLESHLSYPMLGYYRSQHDNESWLAALTTVLDTCALLTLGLRDAPAGIGSTPALTPGDAHHGLARHLPTFQARMTFATARLAVVEMARALHRTRIGTSMEGSSDSAAARASGITAAQLFDEAALGAPAPRTGRQDVPERLPQRALARLAIRLGEVGLVIGDGEEAGRREDLAVLRRTYEPFVEVLSARLLLPLPRWVAYDDATDNWQQSVGGQDAKRIVDDAGAADAAKTSRPTR